MHCAELFQRSAGVAGALLHIKQGNTRIQREREGGKARDACERRGEARGNPPFQARDSTTAVIMFPAVSLCADADFPCAHALTNVCSPRNPFI